MYEWIAVRPDFFNLSVMYIFYNNNFQCSVLQFRKVFFTNYITKVSLEVLFCLKFYLTLIKKTPVFTVKLGLTDNRTNLKLSLLNYVLFSCQTYNYDLNKTADTALFRDSTCEPTSSGKNQIHNTPSVVFNNILIYWHLFMIYSKQNPTSNKKNTQWSLWVKLNMKEWMK